MMNISWFIPKQGKYVRVEENLVNLSKNQLVFSRKNKNYALRSAYNLKELLIDDVLYAFQLKDRLYPIKGSPNFNPENMIGKYVDVEPDKLKEILEYTRADLQKEIDKLKDLIQFELQKNAEEDLKKMDFLQNVDSYRNILYKKFIDLMKEQADDMINNGKQGQFKAKNGNLLVNGNKSKNNSQRKQFAKNNNQKSINSEENEQKSEIKESTQSQYKKIKLKPFNEKVSNSFK